MTTPRRQREWHQETNELVVGAGSQGDTAILGTNFTKGTTIARVLLELGMVAATTGADVNCHYALWVGASGSVPSDISANSERGFMLWNAVRLVRGAATGEPQVIYRTYDLRAQRKARDDLDNLFLVVMATGSQIEVLCASRVLYLLS